MVAASLPILDLIRRRDLVSASWVTSICTTWETAWRSGSCQDWVSSVSSIHTLCRSCHSCQIYHRTLLSARKSKRQAMVIPRGMCPERWVSKYWSSQCVNGLSLCVYVCAFCACVLVYVCVCALCVSVYVCLYWYVCKCMFVCLCVYVCMYVYVCLFVCVYVYTNIYWIWF